MTLAVELLNAEARERTLKSLGIDELTVEWCYFDGQTVVDCGKRFYPWRAHWSVGPFSYEAVIPARTRREKVGAWPFRYEIAVEDVERMEKTLRHLIARSHELRKEVSRCLSR